MQRNEFLYKGILIIDDNEMIVDLIFNILQRSGYKKLYRAYHGIEGLGILEQFGGEIDLLILDMKLPSVDGIAVLQHLLNVHKHIVGVITITGHNDEYAEDDIKKLSSEKIIHYSHFSKPFDQQRLVRTIEKTLSAIQNKRIAASKMSDSQVILDSIDAVHERITASTTRTNTAIEKGLSLEQDLGYLKKELEKLTDLCASLRFRDEHLLDKLEVMSQDILKVKEDISRRYLKSRSPHYLSIILVVGFAVAALVLLFYFFS